MRERHPLLLEPKKCSSLKSEVSETNQFFPSRKFSHLPHPIHFSLHTFFNGMILKAGLRVFMKECVRAFVFGRERERGIVGCVRARVFVRCGSDIYESNESTVWNIWERNKTLERKEALSSFLSHAHPWTHTHTRTCTSAHTHTFSYRLPRPFFDASWKTEGLRRASVITVSAVNG